MDVPSPNHLLPEGPKKLPQTLPQTHSQPQAQAQAQPFPYSYRAQLIQKAFGRVPCTTEGLPVGFYRVDLLPNQATDSQEEIQALQVAYQDLSYEHGYPTLHDGRPYWHKLEFEPGFAYGAFQIYLEQLNLGPREITALAKNEELKAIATKTYCTPAALRPESEADERGSSEKGSSESVLDPVTGNQVISEAYLGRILQEFSILYYWRSRSKAHDIYQEAAYRHLRLRRQMTTEGKHFDMAQTLMDKLQGDVFSDKEFWTGMSAKTAVDFLKALVAIQRVSLGLPAAGPLSQKETPADTTFELIMRSLAQKASSGNVYDATNSQTAAREILQGVLKDEGATANLQELVIRITQASHQQLPDPNGGNGYGRTFKGRGRTVEAITNDDLNPAYDIEGAPQANLDSDGTPDKDNNKDQERGRGRGDQP